MKYHKITKQLEIEILNDYNLNTIDKKQIANKHDISMGTLRNILKRNGILDIRIETYSKYKKDTTRFETINNEETAYFLGMLMADGTLVEQKGFPRGVKLSLVDIDVIEKFKKFFNTDAPIRIDKRSENHQITYTLEVSSAKIAKDLIKLGVINNKTFRTMIPEMNEEFIRHFIRGYFDGDGCLYTRKNKNCRTCLITSSSELILKQIEGYCKLRDIIRKNKNIYVQKYRKYHCWDFRLDHRYEIYKFLQHIYKDATVYMERKYQHWLEIKDIPLMTKKNYAKNKYFGVAYHPPNKSNPYEARFTFNGIKYKLGYFLTENEAALAYNAKITELGLPETMLNKIEENPTQII